MYRRITLAVVVFLQAFVVVFGCAPVLAQTLITQQVGSGSNESFFVLDFNDGASAQSYAFSYRYDGAKTGEDLLNALAGEAGLRVTAQESPFGLFVVSLGYNDQSQTGGAAGYWSYWLSPNGADWAFSGVGVRDRTLSDGSWDGWSWAGGFQATPPQVPQANAIPEPSPLALVSIGLLGLIGGGIAHRRKPEGQQR